MTKTQQELVSLKDGPKQSGLSAYISDHVDKFDKAELETAVYVFKLTEQNVYRNRGAAIKLLCASKDHDWDSKAYIRFAKLEDLLDENLEDS